jgi:hypothetical protein
MHRDWLNWPERRLLSDPLAAVRRDECVRQRMLRSQGRVAVVWQSDARRKSSTPYDAKEKRYAWPKKRMVPMTQPFENTPFVEVRIRTAMRIASPADWSSGAYSCRTL